MLVVLVAYRQAIARRAIAYLLFLYRVGDSDP
jgi:hypothetical protein